MPVSRLVPVHLLMFFFFELLHTVVNAGQMSVCEKYVVGFCTYSPYFVCASKLSERTVSRCYVTCLGNCECSRVLYFSRDYQLLWAFVKYGRFYAAEAILFIFELCTECC